MPAFAPSIHDYYVQCEAGVNDLTVAMKAAPGAQANLVQPATSSSSAEQVVTVGVGENKAVVVAATQGTASTAYWVRCLPAGFPGMQMDLHPALGTAAPGYYLIGNEVPVFGSVAYAMVIDSNGVPVWYYPQPQTGNFFPTTGAFDVDSPSVGTVSFISWSSQGALAPFEIHDLASSGTKSVSTPSWALDPHELRALANGDFLIFTDQLETVDLTGYNLATADGGVEHFGPNSPMLPCDILEVDPSGTLIWKWIGTDHLDPVKDNTLPGFEAGPDGVAVADPFHCNSIDVDVAHGGNLLVSARHMDSIFYIDRDTSKILWKMGGSSYTKDDAAYVPVPDAFYRQHDARFQPGWSSTCGGTGQISLFDDHSYEPGPARGVIYDVNVGDGASCASAAATVTFQYAGARYSNLMGNFRVMSDGSSVIGWGVNAGSPVFTEVDASGNDLLDFRFTQSTWSFRAIKVPLSQLDLSIMRTSTGML